MSKLKGRYEVIVSIVREFEAVSCGVVLVSLFSRHPRSIPPKKTHAKMMKDWNVDRCFTLLIPDPLMNDRCY